MKAGKEKRRIAGNETFMGENNTAILYNNVVILLLQHVKHTK